MARRFDPVRDSVGPSGSGDERRSASADVTQRQASRSASIADILNEDREQRSTSQRPPSGSHYAQAPYKGSASSSVGLPYHEAPSARRISSPGGPSTLHRLPSYGSSVHDSPVTMQRELSREDIPYHSPQYQHPQMSHSRSSLSNSSSVGPRHPSPTLQHSSSAASYGDSRRIHSERSPSLLHILNSGHHQADEYGRPTSSGSGQGLGPAYTPTHANAESLSPSMERYAPARRGSHGTVYEEGSRGFEQYPQQAQYTSSAVQQHAYTTLHPRHSGMRTSSEFAVPDIPHRSPESMRGRTSLPSSIHSPSYPQHANLQSPIAQAQPHPYQHHRVGQYGFDSDPHARPVSEYEQHPFQSPVSHHPPPRTGNSHPAHYQGEGNERGPLHISTGPPYQMPRSPGTLPQTPYAGAAQSPMRFPPTPGAFAQTPGEYIGPGMFHAYRQHPSELSAPQQHSAVPNGKHSPSQEHWSHGGMQHPIDDRRESILPHTQDEHLRDGSGREVMYVESGSESQYAGREADWREKENQKSMRGHVDQTREGEVFDRHGDKEHDYGREGRHTTTQQAPAVNPANSEKSAPLPPTKRRKSQSGEGKAVPQKGVERKKANLDVAVPSQGSTKSKIKNTSRQSADGMKDNVRQIDEARIEELGASIDETSNKQQEPFEADVRHPRRSPEHSLLPYAPTIRVSMPGVVRIPVTSAELERLRNQSRNPLRLKWQSENANRSDGWDSMITNFTAHQSTSANVGESKQTAKKRKRKTEDVNIVEPVDNGADPNASLVAHHYNSRKDQGVNARKRSPILDLRNYNNWVKSVLIQHFGRKDGRVLELGGGKGGDLNKWDRVRIKHFVLADIAEVSVAQARERFLERRMSFSADFVAGDCFGEQLAEWIPRKILEPMFDNVSLQFCLHYGWESIPRAQLMLENIARYMRPGATFIGTMPDCDQLRHRLQHAVDEKEEATSFGNRFYRVEFDDVPAILSDDKRVEFKPFGQRYTFSLLDAVDNVAEYVVDWTQFESLALQNGLRCVYKKTFEELWHDEGLPYDAPMRGLARKMNIHVDSEIPIEEDLWEASTFYLAFAFEKQSRP